MKIVIDIPDEWKTRIEHNRRPNTIECGELVESIWKGEMLIPQEPIWEKNSIPGPYCPECNEKILTLNAKYCHNCGQAIDLSGFLNYLFVEADKEGSGDT